MELIETPGHRLGRDADGGCMRQPKIFGDDGRGGLLEWLKLVVVDPSPNTLVATGEGGVRKAGWAD